MRTALVNVQYHEGNNIFPPLGVLYLAGAMRAAGHTVQVWDRDPLRQPGLGAELQEFKPDLVGLSFLTMTYDRAVMLAREIRAALPGAFIVAGGAHCTADPEGSLAGLPVDAVAVGEGENTLTELAEALRTGAAPESVPGVHTRTGKGAERAPEQELDRLAFPARDRLGHAKYLRPPGLIRGWASSGIASMLGGRGCPFKCSYCASHQQLGRRVRLRSPENIRAELEGLKATDGIRGMYWVDDVFTHDRDWTLAVCDAIRPLGLSWGCQSRADAVDGPLLRAMKSAGCVQVDVGVESGSPRILKAIHKGVGPEQVADAFRLFRSAGLRGGASFILGFPGETEEDIEATAALAERIRPDWAVFFFATPYPGTSLWRRTVEEQGEDWPAWGERWNNRVGPLPLLESEVSPERVAWWRSRLQNRHFRSNYLRPRNLPFITRLASTLPKREVRGAVGRWMTQGGRADDVVEAAFAAWRPN